jgi:hypothetical protein
MNLNTMMYGEGWYQRVNPLMSPQPSHPPVLHPPTEVMSSILLLMPQ